MKANTPTSHGGSVTTNCHIATGSIKNRPRFSVLIALYPIFAAADKRWRNSLAFAFWSAGGLFAIAGIIGLYFRMRRGLGELVNNVVTHNLEYIGAMTWSDRLQFCSETVAGLARAETLGWIL